MGGILQAFVGMTVDDYGADAHSFVHEGQHYTLDGASATAATGR